MNKGFTAVELIVVLAIGAFLALFCLVFGYVCHLLIDLAGTL